MKVLEASVKKKRKKMEFCETHGFDPEFSVILKGVPPKVKLEEVQRAFASLDDVVKICHVDNLSNTILCQFREFLTPQLLDTEHVVDGSHWEVILIEEYCPPKSSGQPPKESVVPLARVISDMTATFSEQMNHLAQTYNISPVTLRHVALNQICGGDEGDLSPITSTPASAPKTQTLPNPGPGVFVDIGSPISASKAPEASQSVNPLPADVQRVIVEHIVRHDSAAASPTRELKQLSGNVPKPSTEVDYGIWRLKVKQILNDKSFSEAQPRRMILDSLQPPALKVALSIGAQDPPIAYLHELDKAYGNVTGGEELYIQFLETHQDSGEKASEYLRRLQTLLEEVVESHGVVKQDADSQLLKQFRRGCWDDTLLTTLQLKGATNTFTFSELLFKIRAYEKESQLKEMRRKRHLGNVAAKVHSKTHVTTDEPEHSLCHNHIVSDVSIRKQLEERIKQLEAELQKKSVQHDQPFRSDRPVQKLPYKVKGSKVNQRPRSDVPAENVPKVGNFCYNCGEDLHMLPQCVNPTNAALVQKKLCERHQSRQTQRLIPT